MIDDPASILVRFAEAIGRSGLSSSLATRMCLAVAELTGTDGGAITFEYAEPSRMTLCATDAVAARLEDLQEVLGEGPGWEAARTLVLVESTLAGASGWPSFSAQALSEVGDRKMLCAPMRPTGQLIGVLSLHEASDHGQDADHAVIQFLADTVGAALLRDLDWGDAKDSGPWAARSQVHQATGMIAAQLRLGTDDAMAVLRAHAFAQEVSINDVAEQLVQRRLIFSPGSDRSDPEGSP